MTDPTKVYVDGSTTRTCWWFSDKDWSVQHIDKTTSNRGEYFAVLEALCITSRRGIRNLVVCSDSELMVRQLRGEYALRNVKLLELAQEVLLIKGEHFDTLEFQWVSREENPAGRILG